MRFREWLERKMEGRYGGSDDLSRFLLWVGFATFLLGYIGTRKSEGSVAMVIFGVLYYIGFAGLIFNVIRTWSRNITKRQQENQKFLQLKNRLLRKGPKKDRKNYAYFVCPSCKTMTRVPKGKGTIRIKCPKCGEIFVRKS